MLQTHVNNDIYDKYCLIHNTCPFPGSVSNKKYALYNQGVRRWRPTSRSRANKGKYLMFQNENNLGPGKNIKCIAGLKSPIFILQRAANLH